MSAAIGYVETVREDLLDAAWRSTMSSPRRAMRRRPSMRWVVSGATAVTLVLAGVVGWTQLRSDHEYLRAIASPGPRELQQRNRPEPGASTAPATWSSEKTAGNQLGALYAPGIGHSGKATTDTAMAAGYFGIRDVGSINPAGDLSKVVKTGRITVVVGHDTFGDRFSAVGDIADRLGGYLSSSSTSGGKSGSVTMRIPANRFQDALRSLRGLGRVDRETIEGQDVTAQYVDMASRIRIARARRQVLFGLMKKAVSIDQTIRVQNALDDVQLRIEELQGELNVLNDRVSQATIRVSMRETGVTVHAEANVENPSITSAFDHAVAGFFSVVAAVIVGLGWVIPALVVLALLWFVVTRLRRRFA